MATIYVSNSATNGYAVGDDSNTYAQSQSKSTPVLTVTRALAIAQAGDTIKINDGTYSEASYVSVSAANLIINAENAHQVTIRAASGTTRVVHQASTGTGLTLGNIIVDANNTQQYCLTHDSTNTVNDLAISSTHFINFTINALQSVKCKNVTMDDNWLISSSVTVTGNTYAISLNSSAAGTISIKNGTIDVDAPNATTAYLYCIRAVPAVSGCNLAVQNVVMTYDSANPAIYLSGVYAYGFATYDISGNTFTETSLLTTGSYNGVVILNSAQAATKCWIYNNTFTAASPTPGGHNIQVGEDADTSANANSISGIRIRGNKSYNVNHHIICGWVTGAVVQGNYCENGIIGVIGKYTTNCKFTGNILKNITTGGALRAKASSGDIYANNTVILTSASGLAMYVTASAGTASTGIVFKNNIIYMTSAATPAIVLNDGSDATFANSNYYSTAGFAPPAFTYQANTYDTVAAWVAAHEASGLNIDPEFVAYPTDLRIPPTSALYHAGVFAGSDNRDYRGRPFNIKPTIGAYEVTAGDPAAPRTPRAA